MVSLCSLRYKAQQGVRSSVDSDLPKRRLSGTWSLCQSQLRGSLTKIGKSNEAGKHRVGLSVQGNISVINT